MGAFRTGNVLYKSKTFTSSVTLRVLKSQFLYLISGNLRNFLLWLPFPVSNFPKRHADVHWNGFRTAGVYVHKMFQSDV